MEILMKQTISLKLLLKNKANKKIKLTANNGINQTLHADDEFDNLRNYQALKQVIPDR